MDIMLACKIVVVMISEVIPTKFRLIVTSRPLGEALAVEVTNKSSRKPIKRHFIKYMGNEFSAELLIMRELILKETSVNFAI